MVRKSKNSKSRKQGRRNRRQGAGRWASVPRVIRYPILPPNFKCRLRYQIAESLSATTSAYRFGLTQFWNQLPAYSTQLFSIWRLSRIVNTHVRVTLVNGIANNVPISAMAAVVPASEYPLTWSSLGTLTTSKRTVASATGGMDKANLQVSYSTNSLLGVSALTERGYQQSYSEATSTTALISDTPVVQLLLSSYSGGNTTAYAVLVVEYDIEFFELQNAGA